MRAVLVSLFSPFLVATVQASVTIYTQVTFGPGGPSSTASPLVTSPAHHDLAMAQPPPPPTPPNPFVVQLQSAPLPNMSKTVQGNHMGLSIELSVADQVGMLFWQFEYRGLCWFFFKKKKSARVGKLCAL